MSDPKIKILLIEDNQGDALLIREMLGEADGHALAAADRLSSGVNLLREEDVAVVLLDLGLPDSSGIETLLRIQAERPDVPVIVLTGLADDELAARAIGQGAQDYLVKGRIDGELLSRAIRYAIERKKAEQLLKRSEERFRAFFESAGVGAVQLEPGTGRFLMVNDRYCRITGYSREELLAMAIRDVIHPDDRKQDMAGLRRLVEGEIPAYVAEKRYLRKDGRLAWVQMTGTMLRDDDGRPLGIAGIIQEITERKRAEEDLRAAREKIEFQLAQMNAVFDQMTEGLVIFDPEGNQLTMNPAALAIHGFADIADSRRPLGDLAELFEVQDLDGKPLPMEEWPVGRVLRGETLSALEVRVRRRDTGKTWIGSYGGAPVRDRQGRVLLNIVTSRDVTDSRKAEEELQKVQKLESIGLLAGGIAHDFNNILTAILGNITLARMFLPPGDKAVERLAVAEQASMRARGLSQQLLTFARGGAPIKETVAVPHLVREAVGLVLRGTGVKAECSFPPDLWPVEADESQLNQAISNLALNGVQAMPTGGILTVGAANAPLPRENSLGLPEGQYVKIDIRDQGGGIPEEVREKIFDPYFTTKEQGSGLGLTISFSIVKRHGGTITVDASPGAGSTFSIILPASKKRMAAPVEEKTPEAVTGTGRVLVMDDEEAISDVAGEMLRHLGYRVETARNGVEAITAYQKAMAAGDPFAAVITDLTVPAGMGGKETVRRLLTIDPQAKVIVSSGYGNDPVLADYATYGFKGVIAKPYRLAELSRTLREVLGSPQA